jgi:hypothetical protein
MEVNAQLNGAAILIRRIFTGTRFVGGLIEHRASVDISEKEKNLLSPQAQSSVSANTAIFQLLIAYVSV